MLNAHLVPDSDRIQVRRALCGPTTLTISGPLDDGIALELQALLRRERGSARLELADLDSFSSFSLTLLAALVRAHLRELPEASVSIVGAAGAQQQRLMRRLGLELGEPGQTQPPKLAAGLDPLQTYSRSSTQFTVV